MRLIHKIDDKNNVEAGGHPCTKIKFIIGILIGMILAGGIGSFATYKYFATEIEYTDEKSVSQALNELYGMKTNLDTLNSSINQTDALASDILSGKKAYTKNGLITGTAVIGNGVNDTITIPSNYTKDTFDYNCNFQPSLVFIHWNGNAAWFYVDSKCYGVALPGNYCDEYSNLIYINKNGFSINTKDYDLKGLGATIYAVKN